MTDWPDFSLGEAINQVIAGLVAFAAVLAGAWLALRQARWQIATQRAFDRHVTWLEEAIVLVHDFQGPLEDMFADSQWADRFSTEVIDRHTQALIRHLELADVYLEPQRAAEAMRFVARFDEFNERWRRLAHERKQREGTVWDSDTWHNKVRGNRSVLWPAGLIYAGL